MNSSIRRQIRASIAVKEALLADAALSGMLQAIVDAAVGAYRQGGKLLLAGNGGSAGDAQHIAGEMVNRFLFDRPGLPAIALSSDPSVVTAIGNDAGFDRVFARQVEALGRAGDVFLAITTSGRSPNILRALEACRERSLVRVAFTGQDGAGLAALCDHCLVVPSRETPRIQEAHILLAHIFCGLVEEALFGGEVRGA